MNYYIIVEAVNTELLSFEVNKKIKNGYIPHGNMIHSESQTYYYDGSPKSKEKIFYQPMILKESKGIL